MTFSWPEALLLLSIIPALIAVYVWMQSRRSKYAVRYARYSDRVGSDVWSSRRTSMANGALPSMPDGCAIF